MPRGAASAVALRSASTDALVVLQCTWRASARHRGAPPRAAWVALAFRLSGASGVPPPFLRNCWFSDICRLGRPRIARSLVPMHRVRSRPRHTTEMDRLCPPVAQTNASTWLVLFHGHSGSSAFTESLSNYVQRSRRVRISAFEPLTNLKNKTQKAKLQYTRDIFDGARRDALRGESDTVGFKMRPEGASLSEWHALLREHGTLLIFQRETNPLRDVLKSVANAIVQCHLFTPHHRCADLIATRNSLQFLMITNHSIANDMLSVLPIAVNVAANNRSFSEVVRARIVLHAQLEAGVRRFVPHELHSQVLHVSYHSFLQDNERAVARALAHMGVDPCPYDRSNKSAVGQGGASIRPTSF